MKGKNVPSWYSFTNISSLALPAKPGISAPTKGMPAIPKDKN